MILYIGAVGSVTATLLTNGGFESDTAAPPSSWIAYDSQSVIGATAGWAASEGTNGCWLRGWTVNMDGGIYQDVAVTPGLVYRLDADIKLEADFKSSSGTVSIALQYLDASNAVISETSHSWEPGNYPGTTAFFAIDPLASFAPSGAVNARTRLHYTTMPAGASGSAMADALVLTESAFGLLNGGFEADTAEPPAYWTAYGTQAVIGATAGWAATEGTNGCWLRGWLVNMNGGIHQDLPALPYYTYTLNGDMKVESGFQTSSGTVSIALQCLDASDTVISEASHSWGPGSYPGATDFFAIDPLVIDRAPNTTAKVRARLYYMTMPVGAAGSSLADNLSLTMVYIPKGTLIIIK